MNTFSRRNTLIALATIAAAGGLIFAGPLTPAAGPVGSTYKTLSEVEPRTAITSLPFTISQSGSYYLAKNLTGAAGSDGITVNADDVTIDLRGFTLTGPGGAGNYAAIKSVQHSNTTVRNGTIRNWPAGGLSFLLCDNGHAEDLVLRDCLGSSIFMGDSSTVRRCTVRAGEGMSLGSASVAESCVLNNTASGLFVGNGGVMRDCSANNVATGLASLAVGEAGTISGCSVNGAQTQGINAGAGATVSGNTVRGCSGVGIALNTGCSALNNTVTNGTAGAFLVAASGVRLEGNLAVSNSIGYHITGADNLLIRNAARANTTNYSIAANNEYGQIIANPGANFTTTSAFANFAY